MVKLTFENESQKICSIASEHIVDLSTIDFLDPWAIGLVSAMLVERHNDPEKKLLLPTNPDTRSYLCRLHFPEFLEKVRYVDESRDLAESSAGKRENLNIHELYSCQTKDEFEGRLPRFISIFQNFGLDLNSSRMMTAVVGELGNNVFDHNLGNWPTDISGCIILAQRYGGSVNRIQVTITDFGAGFFASLKPAYPEIQDDVEAIKKGLSGYTGRIGENRGNGLKTVQGWTIGKFHGSISIRSGSGSVSVDSSGVRGKSVPRVLGTTAQFMIQCK